LRIERIETYPLLHKITKPYGDANGFKKYRTCYLIKIVTQSGIEGWGECIDWLPTLEIGFQERIIPYLIGKNAANRSQLVKVIKKWHQRAAAGVSMALTEILAKKAGLSICDLWGGKWHESIPVYASFQSYRESNHWEKESLDHVEKAVQEGFSQVKVKIGGKTIREDQHHIQLLQGHFAGRIQMAIDANQSYDVAATRSWNSLFNQWNNVMWLEEPIPMDRVEDYKLLRSVLNIPLAGGENIASAKEFLPILRKNAIDILNPDPMHQDGIDGYRDSLQLARQFGARVSPHAFDGTLTRLYALFAQACLAPWTKMEEENIEPTEWDYMENPFSKLLNIHPINGRVVIPSQVGIGVEIDWDLVQFHRWDGEIYV
jgi:D-galactarolactone cycloisomerase